MVKLKKTPQGEENYREREMKNNRRRRLQSLPPQPTELETTKQVEETEKDEEHHIPDTLEKQLEKLMGEGEKTPREHKRQRERKRGSQRF